MDNAQRHIGHESQQSCISDGAKVAKTDSYENTSKKKKKKKLPGQRSNHQLKAEPREQQSFHS